MKQTILALCLLAAPASGQVINCPAHNTKCDATENVLAGAALNVLLRGPYVKWRQPVPRVALGVGVSALYFAARAYEQQGQQPLGYHFDWFNFGWTVVGLVGAEVVVQIWTRVT